MDNRKIKLSDEDKQLVSERYSDIEWCDDVTHMQCFRCHRVAVHHSVHNYKDLICRDCRNHPTPQRGKRYRKFHKALTVPDEEIESEICQLKVCCPNKKYGCQQVDQLGYIVDHIRGCLICLNTKDTSRAIEQTELIRHIGDKSAPLRQMNGKQMQTMMNEIEFKVDNNNIKVDQHTNDLDAVKAYLYLQTERLTNVKHKGKDVETTQNNVITSDKRLDAINNLTAATDNTSTVTTINKTLTLMEISLYDYISKQSPFEYYEIIMAERKRLKNSGEFGTLGQKHRRLVSEFIWRVENIEKEMIKAKDNERYYIESKPFYTNVPGYKCRLRLFPNDRKSNHLGVYLSFVEGEFDEMVPWPFNCKYKIYSVSRDGRRFASITVNPRTEINRQDSFSQPLNKHTGYGSGEYVQSETLLTNQDRYLTDGVLSIKATIWIDNTITLFHQWILSRVENKYLK